jgi:hypothetical protein
LSNSAWTNHYKGPVAPLSIPVSARSDLCDQSILQFLRRYGQAVADDENVRFCGEPLVELFVLSE